MAKKDNNNEGSTVVRRVKASSDKGSSPTSSKSDDKQIVRKVSTAKPAKAAAQKQAFKASALSAKINQGAEEVVYCLQYLGLQGEQKNMLDDEQGVNMSIPVNKKAVKARLLDE